MFNDIGADATSYKELCVSTMNIKQYEHKLKKKYQHHDIGPFLGPHD